MNGTYKRQSLQPITNANSTDMYDLNSMQYIFNKRYFFIYILSLFVSFSNYLAQWFSLFHLEYEPYIRSLSFIMWLVTGYRFYFNAGNSNEMNKRWTPHCNSRPNVQYLYDTIFMGWIENKRRFYVTCQPL